MKFEKMEDVAFILRYREDVRELLSRVYSTNFNNSIITEAFLDKEITRICDYIIDGSAVIFVCVDEKKLVGIIWAYECSTIAGREFHIPILVVDERHERMGISSRLLDEIKEIARARRIERITLLVSSDNNDALSFYENREFIETRKKLECKVKYNEN